MSFNNRAGAIVAKVIENPSDSLMLFLTGVLIGILVREWIRKRHP